MREWNLHIEVDPAVTLPPVLPHSLVEPGPSRPYVLKRARLWRRDLGANVDLMIEHDGAFEEVEL